MMKTLLYTYVVVSVLIFAASMAVADVITIRADEWCPYNCDPDSDRPGFMIEIAQTVFERAGHTVDYQILPWERALNEAKKGRINGLVGLLRQEEPEFIFPDQETGYTIAVFYVQKDEEWRYTGIQSLEQVSLGGISGYYYGEEVNAYIQEHKKDDKHVQLLFGETAFQRNVQKLLNERISALLANRFVMSYFLHETEQQGLLEEAGESQDGLIYIGFSPAHPKSQEYAGILSKGTEQLRQSGELEQILARYGLQDWK